MQPPIPQSSKRTNAFISSLVFLIAVSVSLLPASARRAGGNPSAGLSSSARWQDTPDVPASTEPTSPAAAFVVNDNGDAADISIGNGICDSNAAPGDQCTLRAAIQEANSSFGNDTITFNLPPSSTITLNTALPDLVGNLTITGPGASLLTVRRNSAGGTPNFRVFTANNITAIISGLTITNGRTADGLPGPTSGGTAPFGGGILSSGSMTLTDMVITGNATGNGGDATTAGSTFGGPGGFGGGISSTGTLTMTNVTVSNNTTGHGGNGGFGHTGGRGGGVQVTGTLNMTQCIVTGNNTGIGGVGSNAGASGGGGGDGGGIHAESGTFTLTNLTVSNNNTGDASGESGTGGHGGGLLLNGTATLTNSTVSNNTTGDGSTFGFVPQGGLGGGIISFGLLTISGSTISGNSTGATGNGGGAKAGGVYNSGTLNLVNTTLSGNSTTATGGGVAQFSGTLNLTNVTVVNNRCDSENDGSGSGGGIWAFGGNITLKNTIVASNFQGPGTVANDIDAPINSASSFNLVGTGGSGGLTNGVNGNQVGVADALLGPLADNGGPTQTHAILSGSTASDAGDNSAVTNPPFAGPPFTDQRGAGFSRIADGPDGNATATVDIGAYENQPLFPNLADTSGNEDTTVIVAFEVLDSGSITSITATSSNTTLVPNNPANIAVTGTGANRVLTINPVANLSGGTDITVTVNRTGGSEVKTFALTINPVNDAPSFTKGADQSVNENSGAQTVNNWATGISTGPADESSQTLTFQVTNNSNAALFAVPPAISASGRLTYTPVAGQSGSASITIALKDDGGTGSGGSDTSPSQTFNVNVLEGGSLQFSSFSYSVNEATASATITVNRFGGSAGEARVDYATNDGAALAGFDYTATSGTLIFPDGVTSQTFAVSIINDVVDETTEPLGLKLTNAAGTGALGSPTEVSLLIIDDDPQPTLTINDVAVVEGDSGTVNAAFTLTLSAPTSFVVSANLATADNSATTPSDYQQALGQVSILAGQTSKTINVVVNGDTTPEVNETFFVNLSNVTGASLTDSQGIGTILSDDAPGGTFSFNVLHDNVNENAGFATIVVNRGGNTGAAVTVDYATFDANASLSPCSTSGGLASARCDFITALGTLRFAAGETSQSFRVLINQDNFIEPPETLTLTLGNPTGGAVFGTPSATFSGSLTIFDDATEPAQNPIDGAEAFVRQHYHDFLNREADPSGLAFWIDQITSCGSDAQCTEIRRINVSAAFYLSIEFQETGFLVERIYKASYGTALGTSTLGGTHQIPVPVIRLTEFLGDSQEIAHGVVVGQPGWELVLAANKQLFVDRFVQRTRFLTAFPLSMTASQFVDKLNTNAGGVLLPADRIQLINDLSSGAKTRAQVVRAIAEDSDLVTAEKNQAFVLMQYYGYLRRNPNDTPDTNYTGYEFWLNKLNQFGGNFVNADMVKSFIVSGEYRQRFGQ